jgi:hypothetical protein
MMLKPLRNSYYSTLCTHPGYNALRLAGQYVVHIQNLYLMNVV